MLTFGTIAAVLMILAIAFVVPPLLKKNPSASDVDRNTLNVAIYKERIAELEQENLTPEQLAQAKQELEKTLAQDLNNNAAPAPQARARWASVVVAIGIPVLAIAGYWQLGAWQLLTLPQTQATHNQDGGMPANFDEMVNKLAARLQQQPDDVDGWRMLARSYMYLKRYNEAAQVYNKLLALVGDQDPQLLSDLAFVLAILNNNQFAGQPTILLKAALDLDPNHQEVLWFLGLAAEQKKDYTAAIGYWQRALQVLSSTDVEGRQALEARIAEARSQLDDAPALQEMPSVTQTDSTDFAKIEVHVSLDPTLQDKVKPNDTLFIYARAVKGPPMPLAIEKKSASELPITVTLDDSMSMMPSMKLSSFQEIMVLARISSSGSAMLQSGDLQGQVSPIVLGKQDKVEVVINRVTP